MAPKGTVVPARDFDAEKDADSLRRAMKGMGTDEKTIWTIIPARTNAQRQAIALSYKTQFGRDLVEDLKSEISSTFQSLMVALMVPSELYDASELRHAIKGLGTSENVLIEILGSRTCAEVQRIKEVYKREYESELESDITGDTSGHFQRLLVALVQANRDLDGQIDDAKVEKDAQDLFKAGENKWGTDEEKFITILGTRCPRHLRHEYLSNQWFLGNAEDGLLCVAWDSLSLMFDKFMTISGYQIEESIDHETSGSLEKLLLAIVMSIRSVPSYLAGVLHHAMKGAGTDEATLVRVMVSRSEIDLHDIRQMFRKNHGASLHDMIQSDTSGDCRHSLLQLCGGNDA